MLIWQFPNVLFAIQIADWQMNASCLPTLGQCTGIDC